MAVLKFYKVAALPAHPEASAFYFLETAQGYTDAWLTDSAGGLHPIGNAQMIRELAGESAPPGVSAENVGLELYAGTNITAGEIVVCDPSGLAIHASTQVIGHSALQVFIATTSAMVGQKIRCQRLGSVEGGWQLVPGRRLYLAENGGITHETTSGLFQLDVGMALTPSSFFFDPGVAIVRA